MELVLIIVPNVFHPTNGLFNYFVIVMQCLRFCVFIIMPCLYFGLRNDKKVYDNADAERQSLLRKKVAPKLSSSEDSSANGSGYGSTNAQESDTAENSEAESEDSWLAEQRKAQELISKRLKQDGNWFTYAKGFTVGPNLCIMGNKHADQSEDILSLHLADTQQDSSIQSCPRWTMLACYKRLECSSSQSNGRNDR